MPSHHLQRQPLVSMEDAWLEVESSNPVGRNTILRRVISDTYGSTILPPGLKFHPDEVQDVYISERRWLADLHAEPFTTNPYPYESYLDHQFWDKLTTERLVFLLGSVGSGKSTLLDYYLRCYCPYQSLYKDNFNEKLVLRIDVKDVRTTSGFRQRQADAIEAAVRLRATAMGLPPSAVAQAKASDNLEEWLGVAISTLSSYNGGRPINYIVALIDNVDNCPAEVQKDVLRLCRDWLEFTNSIALWRIYVPLWPRTLDRLRSSFGDAIPTVRYTTIQIGPVQGERLQASRRDKAVSGIKNSAVAQVLDDSTDAAEPDDTETRAAASKSSTDGRRTSKASTAATYVANEEIRRYVEHAVDSFRSSPFGKRVGDLCAGDARRQLKIMDNVLRSRVTWKAWMKRKAQFEKDATASMWFFGDEYTPYFAVSATTMGTVSAFNPDKSHILNLFALSRNSTLCGYHLLTLFREFERISRRRVHSVLSRLDYSSDDIEDALGDALSFNLFHELAGAAPDDVLHTELVIHGQAVDAYLWLLLQPAYVDCAAIVTPVEAHRAGKMCRTSPLPSEDFGRRVESTIEFIQQIRADEVVLIRHLSRNADSRLDSRTGLVSSMAIPFLWKQVALRYHSRLSNIYAKKLLFNETTDSDWWRRVLNHEVFYSAKDGPWEIIS